MQTNFEQTKAGGCLEMEWGAEGWRSEGLKEIWGWSEWNTEIKILQKRPILNNFH